jgi:integrase
VSYVLFDDGPSISLCGDTLSAVSKTYPSNWNRFVRRFALSPGRKRKPPPPEHQHLPSIVSLARTRRRHAVAPVEEHLRHEWILVNGRRRPWAPNAFRKAWGASASRAGIIGLHFHDLGGTAVTRLSEAECTPQEIARFTGHSLRDVAAILDRYLARTDKLASAALAKLERARR